LTAYCNRKYLTSRSGMEKLNKFVLSIGYVVLLIFLAVWWAKV
jgi:hypothetical protein